MAKVEVIETRYCGVCGDLVIGPVVCDNCCRIFGVKPLPGCEGPGYKAAMAARKPAKRTRTVARCDLKPKPLKPVGRVLDRPVVVRR